MNKFLNFSAPGMPDLEFKTVELPPGYSAGNISMRAVKGRVLITAVGCPPYLYDNGIWQMVQINPDGYIHTHEKLTDPIFTCDDTPKGGGNGKK